MSLKVLDLFCGAGGFSEGFRQAGFEVTVAVDNWRPAVLTHRHNHPSTRVIEGNILEVQPMEIGPVDVIIGSPPCTQFSMSNRGGSGDADSGMELVRRFLHFVAVLRPRWWAMENVPRVVRHLPPAGGVIQHSAIGINDGGALVIPRILLVDAADFGVPQHRLRAFIGSFPDPVRDHSMARAVTLGDVIRAFPEPLAGLRELSGDVQDPVYRRPIGVDELSDHFGQWTRLDPEEIAENAALKEDHPFYGRMTFPDETARPARTQMATMHRIARETTVIGNRVDGLRLLTVRESSSVQGFPTSYQWLGRTVTERYRLIGNAVPPPLAYAIARGIAAAAGNIVPLLNIYTPPVIHHANETRVSRRRIRRALGRQFHWHVSGSRILNYRVELDNAGANPAQHKFVRGAGNRRVFHACEWRAVLHHGTGKGFTADHVQLDAALQFLLEAGANPTTMRSFVRAVIREAESLPDATTLQCVWTNRVRRRSPRAILVALSRLVVRYFPENTRVVTLRARGSHTLPLPVAAALVACSVAVAYVNDGTAYFARATPYLPDEWHEVGRLRAKPPQVTPMRGKIDRALERAIRRTNPRSASQTEVEQLAFPRSS